MDERPWVERTFGESWETTVAGFGGAVLAIICVILGKQLELSILETTGEALLAVSVAALGLLARSNSASQKKAGQLDRRIDNTQHQMDEVVVEARDEAKKVAVEVSKDEKKP